MPTLGRRSRPGSLGLFGFGAFGRLAARHLASHFTIRVFDPALDPGEPLPPSVAASTLERAAECDVVVLALPVEGMADALRGIAPHLRPGALVLDVGSVKTDPARLMDELLPAHVDVVATHPLFGPESARGGLAGLKIALCPVRGRGLRWIEAFLRRAFGLEVVVTTPEAHDREAAMAQGLTHLIAKVLVEMGPLPERITTRSFDLLREAIGMVRNDAPCVFDAIERANPHAPAVRRRFLELTAALGARLDAPPPA
ncbi:prephenate dehydrogenase/arogenate dehydrogenase family protein [Antarcticirhabdus aurantiaca]|uniref:prephenate dehydrogenase/arogenate dehydrogenase family protein n=1 Tax=Antarcticirhabdus aurantiaca TaxID=2606717 RepID=UPI003BB77C31